MIERTRELSPISLGKPWTPWLFLLPTLALLGLFVLVPALRSLYLSFFEVIPFSGDEVFVGFANYSEMLSAPEWLPSLVTSLLFVLYTVPTSIIISLALAVGLNANPHFRGTLQTIFMLPVGISSAMAAMVWIFLFNPSAGYLNYLIGLLGIDGPNWLGNPHWALISVSLTSIWKEVGFNVIFFLAGLSAIPQDLYEAADLDGARGWQRFRSITLPLISPTMLFVVIVSIIHAFESFGQIHILTRGGPADATNVLVYQLYRDGFENFRTGYASAQAVFLFVVIFALTMMQTWLARNRVHYTH